MNGSASGANLRRAGDWSLLPVAELGRCESLRKDMLYSGFNHAKGKRGDPALGLQGHPLFNTQASDLREKEK